MLTFLSRRLIAFDPRAAGRVVRRLPAVRHAGDPLDDLRTSTARNKEELIQQRIALLNLNVPAPLRYFIWLGGVLKVFIGQFRPRQVPQAGRPSPTCSLRRSASPCNC